MKYDFDCRTSPTTLLKHVFLHNVCGEAADDADIQQNCASAATLPKIIEEVENHPILEAHGSRFPQGLLDPTRHIGLTDMPFPISTMNH